VCVRMRACVRACVRVSGMMNLLLVDDDHVQRRVAIRVLPVDVDVLRTQ